MWKRPFLPRLLYFHQVRGRDNGITTKIRERFRAYWVFFTTQPFYFQQLKREVVIFSVLRCLEIIQVCQRRNLLYTVAQYIDDKDQHWREAHSVAKDSGERLISILTKKKQTNRREPNWNCLPILWVVIFFQKREIQYASIIFKYKQSV